MRSDSAEQHVSKAAADVKVNECKKILSAHKAEADFDDAKALLDGKVLICCCAHVKKCQHTMPASRWHSLTIDAYEVTLMLAIDCLTHVQHQVHH